MFLVSSYKSVTYNKEEGELTVINIDEEKAKPLIEDIIKYLKIDWYLCPDDDNQELMANLKPSLKKTHFEKIIAGQIRSAEELFCEYLSTFDIQITPDSTLYMQTKDVFIALCDEGQNPIIIKYLLESQSPHEALSYTLDYLNFDFITACMLGYMAGSKFENSKDMDMSCIGKYITEKANEIVDECRAGYTCSKLYEYGPEINEILLPS